MNEDKWVDAFTVPPKAKFALFLLSFFAIMGFGFVGYKMGSFTLMAICSALCIGCWGYAFKRTWICVDEQRQLIIIKRRFWVTWSRSISYKGKLLKIDGSPISSPSFQQHDQTGTHDIFLVEQSSKRGIILFSSNIGRDYLRVLHYLKSYIKMA